RDRQAMLRTPPDVLITTPESLYLMLTSRAREMFTTVEWAIVDEIHAVAQTKRGAHLALTMERLEHQAGRRVQRIGLSATQRPLEEVGRFLVGTGRDCTVIDTGVRKRLDIQIQVPVEDMREPDAHDVTDPAVGGQGTAAGGGDLVGVGLGEPDPGAASRRSIWPAIYPELLDLVEQHRSTIIFVNARRAAERLESTVVVKRMREALIETTVVARNPLDVLAQQIVAMAVSADEWSVPELHELVKRAYPYSELSRELLDNVLDMLDGRYPSEAFAELRPRIVWDRVRDVIRARKGAQQLAVTNAGTIPDRGLFGVHLPDGRRVGELDEELVYEARPGQTFLLGASTWRIEEVTRDRVIVTPAPGLPGAVPF